MFNSEELPAELYIAFGVLNNRIARIDGYNIVKACHIDSTSAETGGVIEISPLEGRLGDIRFYSRCSSSDMPQIEYLGEDGSIQLFLPSNGQAYFIRREPVK